MVHLQRLENFKDLDLGLGIQDVRCTMYDYRFWVQGFISFVNCPLQDDQEYRFNFRLSGMPARWRSQMLYFPPGGRRPFPPRSSPAAAWEGEF